MTGRPADQASEQRPTDLAGRRVAVMGIRLSGVAMAEALLRIGAEVTVLDQADGQAQRSAAAGLRERGAAIALGPAAGEVPAGTQLVATSPGLRPTNPLLVSAAAAGIPVWGEVELAWRLRGPRAAPWLAVTGTNGKTTTTGMLAAILAAAGLRTVACGNIGRPVVTEVTGGHPFDVLAVEMSSFQLHWSSSIRPLAGAVLNLAPDHLDWHGSMAAYVGAKAKILAGGTAVACVDDPSTAALLATAPGRRVGVTLAEPVPGQFGVAGEMLVEVRPDGREVALAPVSGVRPAGAHNVANALAAAALARAYGVEPSAVRRGLADYAPAGHRNAPVARVGGVDYVDDSKATNPHAAAASLDSYPAVVWVAGGDAKGAPLEPLVAAAAPRLRAAVLLGACRAELAAALSRHAPQVPVVTLDVTDTSAMAIAVGAAASLARPGDTVLLAPAAASIDMFRDYAERGELFAAAVRRLGEADR